MNEADKRELADAFETLAALFNEYGRDAADLFANLLSNEEGEIGGWIMMADAD